VRALYKLARVPKRDTQDRHPLLEYDLDLVLEREERWLEVGLSGRQTEPFSEPVEKTLGGGHVTAPRPGRGEEEVHPEGLVGLLLHRPDLLSQPLRRHTRASETAEPARVGDG
jgi:hypothetical protein